MGVPEVDIETPHGAPLGLPLAHVLVVLGFLVAGVLGALVVGRAAVAADALVVTAAVARIVGRAAVAAVWSSPVAMAAAGGRRRPTTSRTAIVDRTRRVSGGTSVPSSSARNARRCSSTATFPPRSASARSMARRSATETAPSASSPGVGRGPVTGTRSPAPPSFPGRVGRCSRTPRAER
jgi:hypothetical protein